jgi:hypothetical protein
VLLNRLRRPSCWHGLSPLSSPFLPALDYDVAVDGSALHGRSVGHDFLQKPIGQFLLLPRTAKRGSAEAEAEERRLLRKRDLGSYPTPTTITLWKWLDRWLSDVKPDVSGSTYEGYARCVERYVKPNVDEQLKLRKFRPEDVKDLYATLRKEPARGGGKLSAHTVLHVHRVLKEALKAAVVERILAL